MAKSKKETPAAEEAVVELPDAEEEAEAPTVDESTVVELPDPEPEPDDALSALANAESFDEAKDIVVEQVTDGIDRLKEASAQEIKASALRAASRLFSVFRN